MQLPVCLFSYARFSRGDFELNCKKLQLLAYSLTVTYFSASEGSGLNFIINCGIRHKYTAVQDYFYNFGMPFIA